jgi:hypothetical protein
MQIRIVDRRKPFRSRPARSSATTARSCRPLFCAQSELVACVRRETMKNAIPGTPDEREADLRRKHSVELPKAVKERAAKDAQLLEKIVGTTIDVKHPHFVCEAIPARGLAIESNPGRPGNKIRRPTDAEAHRTEIWISMCFGLDCRSDVIGGTAARFRKGSAELSKIADSLEAAAPKRQRKTARPIRRDRRRSA